MKILMLIDAWYPHVGGGQVHVWELSKKLSDRGCSVEIVTRNLGKWNESYPNVKVIRLGEKDNFDNIFGRLLYLIKATFYCLFADYDILHAHAFSPGLIIPIVKFFKKKPVIFTVHGEGWKIAGLGLGSKYLQEIVFYKIPYDLEITVADRTLTKKTLAKKVITIPNGVNIPDFKFAIRKRNKINHLLFSGRLFFDKGVDLLIESFREINNRKLTLVIVGDGPEKEKLVSQSKRLKIKFTGFLSGQRYLNQIKKADLLIMPSRVEGMPLRLLEAWASKLPVVATKVGDNEDYIIEGKTGFLAKAADSESITQSINKAAESNLVKVVDSAFDEVKNYTWEKIADRTYREYQKLV